jgi:transcriptional regulator with XRE-family HTH domain
MRGFGWTPALAFGNNLLMNIGKRLRELRKAKNLSQGDLGSLAGFHRCYVSRVEMGHTVPSLQTLKRYAAALDVEMSQLFSGGGTRSPIPERKGKVPHAREVKMLLQLFRRLSKPERRLVLSVARDLVGRKGEHE